MKYNSSYLFGLISWVAIFQDLKIKVPSHCQKYLRSIVVKNSLLLDPEVDSFFLYLNRRKDEMN